MENQNALSASAENNAEETATTNQTVETNETTATETQPEPDETPVASNQPEDGDQAAAITSEEVLTELPVEEPVDVLPEIVEENTPISEEPESIVAKNSETVLEESSFEVIAESKSEVVEETVSKDESSIVMPDKEEHFLEVHHDLIPTEEEHHEEVAEDYNSLSKEELFNRLEVLLTEADAISNKNKVFAVREAFSQHLNHDRTSALSKHIEEGGTKEDFHYEEDAVSGKFFGLFEQYKKHRVEQIDAQEKQKIANLNEKQKLLEQLKALIQNEENMQRAYNEFNELQNKWRAIGPVPANNVRDLHMTYKVFVDRFYDFVKINKELQALDQKKNLLQKLELCDRAEELMLEPSVNKATARIREYMSTWRDIGPVSRDKQQEIWDRFKSAVDKVFEKRRELDDQLKGDHDKNLAAKKELIEKVSQITSVIHDKHNLWQDALKQIVEIQNQYKTIGFAARKENEKLWTQFKGAVDSFFKNKNEFYQFRKKELADNLQRKTELCIQAEGLKESADWKNTSKQLMLLQDEWKKIGPVADKFNQKIWQRFKDACDHFFNSRKNFYKNIDKEYEDNYTKKIELIQQIEGFSLGSDSGADLDQLKAFQRTWSDLGLVPMEKKDEVQQRYRKSIDVLYNKLNIDEREKTRMRYDDKYDKAKPQSGAKSGGGKGKDETHFIQSKINELASEVNVWQNNIGFFGRSKNAEVIKKEFEDKIKNAQDEISVLKEKLKAVKSAE